MRRFEFLAERADQVDQVFLIAFGVDGVALILMPLPPDEPGNLVASSLELRELGIEIVKHFVSGLETVVVLLPRVPVDRLRFGPFIP